MTKGKGARSSQRAGTPPPPSPSPAAAEASTAAPGDLPTVTSLVELISKLDAKINAFIEESRNRWDSLSAALQKHDRDIQEIERRVGGAELKAATSETTAQSAVDQVRTLEQRVRILENHIDDLDNRGRRKNIRLLGLPEREEEGQLTAFLEQWLPQLLNLEAGSGQVRVEWAYRVTIHGPGSNQRPHPVLFRLRSYRERQILLEASRNLGKDPQAMIYKGSKIMLFQDFSPALV
ncbi:uncharacterized protein [Chiloscyllium punctatum]|uniref:uncharacterized protein n=1 Tax=Chiloscyllium punctatum TaxID=137246 RepID=UPI003B638FE1